MQTFITTFDFYILDSIQAHLRCAFLDYFMLLLSAIGNHGEIWIFAGILLCFTKKYRKAGILVLAGLLAGYICGNVLLKNIIARPRPCWLYPDIALLIPTPQDFSFPSGHTLSSVIGAILLTKANKRFGYGAIPLAVLMAFSRLYLYVHYPTDILGGVILASIISFAVWRIGNKIARKQNPVS